MLYINIASVYFFIMIVAVVYWTSQIRSLNGSNYARAAVLLCLAICAYIFGYTMELNATSEAQVLIWNGVEYLGIPFISALWLTVGLMYTGHFARHKVLLYALIYVIPFLTLVFRFTNEAHHLYFSALVFVQEGGRPVLNRIPGPWTYVQTAHSMAMILVTLGLLIHDAIRNRNGNAGKITLMVVASLVAVGGLILSFVNPGGLIIDYMALCLPATTLSIIWAILRYDFLESKSLARSNAFDASHDAIFLVTVQNKIIDCNKSAKQLLAKLGLPLSGGYLDSLFQSHPTFLQSLESDGTSTVQLDIDGQERHYEVSSKSIDGHHISHGFIRTIRDVTETYELNRNLQRQAMMDDLSGLYNRRAFQQLGNQRLKGAEESATPITLLMMDLDHFKRVNDRMGHRAGDLVIRTFGALLRQTLPPGSLIARLGGEEFGVLLCGLDDATVKATVDALLRSVQRQEYIHQSQPFHVTVSIGVAKKTEPRQGLDHLMQLADKALYQSKDDGRNRVTVYERQAAKG